MFHNTAIFIFTTMKPTTHVHVHMHLTRLCSFCSKSLYFDVSSVNCLFAVSSTVSGTESCNMVCSADSLNVDISCKINFIKVVSYQRNVSSN